MTRVKLPHNTRTLLLSPQHHRYSPGKHTQLPPRVRSCEGSIIVVMTRLGRRVVGHLSTFNAHQTNHPSLQRHSFYHASTLKHATFDPHRRVLLGANALIPGTATRICSTRNQARNFSAWDVYERTILPAVMWIDSLRTFESKLRQLYPKPSPQESKTSLIPVPHARDAIQPTTAYSAFPCHGSESLLP
jgi:hypothetical protein